MYRMSFVDTHCKGKLWPTSQCNVTTTGNLAWVVSCRSNQPCQSHASFKSHLKPRLSIIVFHGVSEARSCAAVTLSPDIPMNTGDTKLNKIYFGLHQFSLLTLRYLLLYPITIIWYSMLTPKPPGKPRLKISFRGGTNGLVPWKYHENSLMVSSWNPMNAIN